MVEAVKIISEIISKIVSKNISEIVSGTASGITSKIKQISNQRAARTIAGAFFCICILIGMIAAAGKAAAGRPDPAAVTSTFPAASSGQKPSSAQAVKPTPKPTAKPTASPTIVPAAVLTSTPTPALTPTPMPAETSAPLPTETPAPAIDPSQAASETEILTPAESVNPSAADSSPADPAASDAVTTVPAPAQPAAGPSEVVRIGNTSNAEIAFTFDDSGENLAKILDILNSKGIKGTFFLLAGELKKNPQLWQQAVKDGHLVCNHTVNHYTDLQNKSDEVIRQEILGWEDAAREVLGDEYLATMKADFPYFRSPGGSKSERLQRILGELGYTKTIYWTVEDCYFVKHNPDNISLSQHYINDAENGAIFLLHPGHLSSVEPIIDELQAEGYSFTTVAELLK